MLWGAAGGVGGAVVCFVCSLGFSVQMPFSEIVKSVMGSFVMDATLRLSLKMKETLLGVRREQCNLHVKVYQLHIICVYLCVTELNYELCFYLCKHYFILM